MADSNSRIAWHRAQLKRNRAALRQLDLAPLGGTRPALPDAKRRREALTRKIAESERCISAYERLVRRPLGTDFGSLTNVSWADWNAHSNGER